ncbi:hypothetical protein NDU88_002745 [Pleurodeles waltl]|uniref:Uncharacterized protein n=1 Tax=Pleurodeles waltl TaxID=8319 RepID=A0AAV7PAW7_PLEWA|nr:hypothetical protein NDU88_002745 [Pleurodeles waltl]
MNHYAKVCLSSSAAGTSAMKGWRVTNVKQLSLEDEKENKAHNNRLEEEEEKEKDIFMLSYTEKKNQQRIPRPKCQIAVNGVVITALKDNRASVNDINDEQFSRLEPRLELHPTRVKIYTYGGIEPLPLNRVIKVETQRP